MKIKLDDTHTLKGDTYCCWLTEKRVTEEGKEYEEPETDWSKVEVDTPILVRDVENENWYRRYFAKYENGKVYAWINGTPDLWNWRRSFPAGRAATSRIERSAR